MQDYDMVIQTKREVASREELRRRFYRYHYSEEAFWDRPTKRTVVRPAAICVSPVDTHAKWAIYYHHYVVKVTKGASALRGPHTAKLFLRLNDEEVWIGTCQFTGSWYEKKRLRRSLRLAIRKRKYFASPSALEEEFEVSPPPQEIAAIEVVATQRKRKRRKNDKYPRGCLYLTEGEDDIRTCPKCQRRKRTTGGLIRHVRIKHKRLLCIAYPVRNWNLFPYTGQQETEQAAITKRLQYPSRKATKRDLKSFKMWPPKIWKGKKYERKAKSKSRS